MKRLFAVIVVILFLGWIAPVWSQGFINLNNRGLALVNDASGKPLTGTSFVAQVWYGASASALTSSFAPFPFRASTTTYPGSWNPAAAGGPGAIGTLTGFALGSTVTLRVTVWDSAIAGVGAAQALAKAPGTGLSEIFTYSIPDDRYAQPGGMENMKSFGLISLDLGSSLPTRLFLSAINPSILTFSFRANDKGGSIVAANGIKLTIDGQVVTTAVAPKNADATDVTYTRTISFTPGDHTYKIEVKDTLGNTVTDSGTFTVRPSPGFLNDIEPGKEFYTVNRAQGAIILDGKLDEWKGVPVLADPKFSVPKGSGPNGKYVLFEEYGGGTWSGPDDQTSAVQVIFDTENVYFGFVVTDDYHENAAKSAWNGDSIQLMIASADRSKQVALYNYALGGVEGNIAETIVMHEAGPGGTEAVVTRNGATKRTTYEIKLPKASLAIETLQGGVQFGLGMAINDGDNGAGQNGQKGWGGLGAHAIVWGKTPSETALFTLSSVVPNDIEPGKEYYTASAVTKPIVLDGNLGEWAGVPVLADPKFSVPKGSGAAGTGKYVLFEEYGGGTWSGPDDHTSAVQIVYDADNVYFGFVVTDDYHENAAKSAWNGDSIQLMIASADRQQQVALYNYALGGVEGDIADTIVNHEAGPGGTQAIVTRDTAAKKTYYEIKLPAAAIGKTAPLTQGAQFGLGMAINDGDNGSGQNGQKGWGGLGAHAIVFGKSPKETALITLGIGSPKYDLVEDSVTWDEAKVNAELRGGHLVTITSQEEWGAIRSQLMDRLRGKITWIGASDREQPDRWEWVTGESFGFAPWHPGEPNGSGTVAVMGWDSPEELLWDDYGNGGARFPYLIEWESDVDGDGLPDEWEIRYGLNANDPSDLRTDPDNDGIDNLSEFKAGTDPKDLTPPTILGASADASGTKLILTFSEKVDAVTGGTVSNYSVSPVLSVTAAAVKGNMVTLTTSQQNLNGTEYTVSVSNVQDLSKKTIIADSKVRAYSFVTRREGILKFSAWLGIGGNGVQALLDDPRYPTKPDFTAALFSANSRDAFPNDANDNYGATIEGVLSPMESGNYRFFIYTDDNSKLFLSTDDNEANLVPIAEENGCCNYFTEPNNPRTSEPIALTAGKRYFMRLIYKEGVGADYGQVAWRKQGDPTPASALRPIPGRLFTSESAVSPTGFIQSVLPTPNTLLAGNSIQFLHIDGRTVQTVATTSLEVDGMKVNAMIEKSGVFLTVKYMANFEPGSKYSARVNYLDVNGSPISYDWSFSTDPSPVSVIVENNTAEVESVTLPKHGTVKLKAVSNLLDVVNYTWMYNGAVVNASDGFIGNGSDTLTVFNVGSSIRSGAIEVKIQTGQQFGQQVARSKPLQLINQFAVDPPWFLGTGRWTTIPDGDFENGMLPEYLFESSGNQAEGLESLDRALGNKSIGVKILSSFNGNGVAIRCREVNLEVGKKYVMSGFIKLSESIPNGNAYLDLMDIPDDRHAVAISTKAGWQFVSVHFSVKNSVSTRPRFVVDGNIPKGLTALVDEISITEVADFRLPESLISETVLLPNAVRIFSKKENPIFKNSVQELTLDGKLVSLVRQYFGENHFVYTGEIKSDSSLRAPLLLGSVHQLKLVVTSTLDSSAAPQVFTWDADVKTYLDCLGFGKWEADTDKDGIPDYWEILYGLNVDDSNDAIKDQDKDGVNNIDEYANGTDPSDITAPYLVSGEMVDGVINLRFNEALDPVRAADRKNYQLSSPYSVDRVSVLNDIVRLTVKAQTNSLVEIGVVITNLVDLSGNILATNLFVKNSFPNLYRTRVVSDGVGDSPLYVQVESGSNRWWLTSSSPTSFAAGDDTTQWRNLSNSPSKSSSGESSEIPKILSTLIERIERVLFREDFESVALRPSKDEDFFGAVGFGAVWGPVPPKGWDVDNQGFEAIRITPANPDRDGDGFADLDGVTEWAGWSFARKEFWQSAGGQDRDRFNLARGNVAVADPDEWSDRAHADGLFNSVLKTPEIPLGDAPGRSVSLRFDSSWRPDTTGGNQTAVITASFDGGPQVELARWDSMEIGPAYKPEALSETIVLPINNPSGARTVVLRFQLKDAGNTWWWAIDNLEVRSVFHDVTVVGAKLGEIGVTAFSDRNLDRVRQLREPTSVSRQAVGPSQEVMDRNDVQVIDPGVPVLGVDPLVRLDFETNAQAGINDGRWWLVSNSPTQGMGGPTASEDRWWILSNSPFKSSSLPPYSQVTNRVARNPPYENRPDLAQNKMLGRLEDESFVLNLKELPEHGKVQVTFDLVLMGPVTLGNRFVVQADGRTIDDTGFDNGIMNLQEFPSVAWGARFASFTGSHRVGGDSIESRYSVYKIGYLVEHTNAALALRFSGHFPRQSDIFGIMHSRLTWGIDNLRVAMVDGAAGANGFDVAMIPDASITVNQPWQYEIGVMGGVLNRSDLSFELVRKPEGMSITSAGVIEWTPSLQQMGSTNPVNFVVSDRFGRKSSRSFSLLVNDGRRVIAGKIEYYAGMNQSVAGVRVQFAERPENSAISGANGSYSIDSAAAGSVTLTPILETDVPVANGVTTADIPLIRRHVLGLTLLDSPYKVMAGDANGSDSVTTADITLIRRLILGTATTFSGGLWRFVPSDEAFTNTAKPWTATRMRQYASLAAGTTSGQDFKAIKLGDVNGSWKAPTLTTGSILKSRAKGRLTVGKVRAEAGKTVTIPVSLAGVDQLGSAQMTLSWDASAASYEGVEGLSLGGLSQENLGLTRVNEGLLSLSWDHLSGGRVNLSGAAELFQLKLRPKATTAKRIEIRVTEGPTRLELMDGDAEVLATVDPGWFEIGAPGGVGSDSVSLRFVGLNSDGRMELEARGPEGMKLNLEASDTLKTWAEVQSVTGQGDSTPVKVTLQPDPNIRAKFWRVRVR